MSLKWSKPKLQISFRLTWQIVSSKFNSMKRNMSLNTNSILWYSILLSKLPSISVRKDSSNFWMRRANCNAQNCWSNSKLRCRDWVESFLRKFMPNLLRIYRDKSILHSSRSSKQGYQNLQAPVKVMKRKKIKLSSARILKHGRRLISNRPSNFSCLKRYQISTNNSKFFCKEWQLQIYQAHWRIKIKLNG